jgi:hypothetical protein
MMLDSQALKMQALWSYGFQMKSWEDTQYVTELESLHADPEKAMHETVRVKPTL